MNTFSRRLHPDYTGEQIYQEVRRIVGAQLQVITYRHWLPIILGDQVNTSKLFHSIKLFPKQGLRELGPYRGYNSSVNPSVSNVFATAAMRFGHTLVNKNLIDKLRSQKRSSSKIPRTIKLRKSFFSSGMLFQNQTNSKTSHVFPLDHIINGLIDTPHKLAHPRQVITTELTSHLFGASRIVPLDLASINIQRGRDHGLLSYNEWRAWCDLKRATKFEDLAEEITDHEIRQKLEKLYKNRVNHVDLWVGGVLEKVPKDAKIGRTFRCLLVDQFRRLRDGDRFYYRNIFNSDQIEELESKTSLAKIFCDNWDGNGGTVVRNVFVQASLQTKVDCQHLPKLDLSKF